MLGRGWLAGAAYAASPAQAAAYTPLQGLLAAALALVDPSMVAEALVAQLCWCWRPLGQQSGGLVAGQAGGGRGGQQGQGC